ncbi:huntingtin [Onthophagus taurus]|uniref:huntingtin n=1 Tax=Onthophagus taurus TaxID=166361 RepID=UPI0039BE3975
MATQEKLLKSLEGLQQLINIKGDNISSRKKEKVQHCHFITEAITNSAIKIAPNFSQLLSFTFETLLELCNDAEADIRTIADESLNKIIRVLNVDNIGKIQLELHKEIKKNAAARSLKAALWRFGNLAHMIRVYKGKPYVVNLIPCIVKISEREEEFLHDTLTESLPKILKILGCFTNDGDVKTLMKAFLKNICQPSPGIRRNSAKCILILCLNCRRPYYFMVYALNQLLDLLLPVDNECNSFTILGVLGGVKVILPNLNKKEDYQEMVNSFGAKKDLQEIVVSLDRQIQIYELCLHYLSYNDHNIINMALETLNILLQNCQKELKEVLLSKSGITQSKIKHIDPDLNKGSPYEMSIASSRSSEEKLLDSLSDPLTSDIEKWIDQSTLSIINVNYTSLTKNLQDESKLSLNFDNVDTGEVDFGEISKSNSDLEEIAKTDGSFDNINASEVEVGSQYSYLAEDTVSIITLTDVTQDIDIGSFKDINVPLIYCSRLIVKSFLLTGQPKGLIPDRNVRVSVKNLALTCLGSIIQLYPDILLLNLDVNYTKNTLEPKQFISDVLLFENDPDPQLAGITRIVVGLFLQAVLKLSYGKYEEWLNSKNCDNDRFKIENLVQILIRGFEHNSSICVRQSLSSLNHCMKEMLYSDKCECVLPILKVLPLLAKDPYWLVKIKLVEIVTHFEYITIEYVTGDPEFQNKIVYNVLLELLKDEDQRVRNATSNSIVKIMPMLYFQQQTPNQNVIINKAIEYKNKYLKNISNLNAGINVFKNSFLSTAPFPFNVSSDSEIEGIEFGLSRIILKLHETLLTSTSKQHIYGCIETLCLLSQTYPCTVYKSSWNCFKNFNFQQEKTIFQRSNSIIGNISSICESNVSCAKDLLNISISLFSHITVYDLNFHSNLLKFTGNLFAGKCLQDLQLSSDTLENNRPLWDMFNDKSLRELSETFLTHIIKLLNVFMHVIEEITPQIIVPKPVLPNLPPASTLSPLKRRKSDLDKKLLTSVKTDKDEKIEKKPENVKNISMGYFANLPHYMKIYDILRMAYLNYKITLDSSASENLLNFLKTTLSALCQILEVATITETGRIADDILRYLRASFYLDQASTVSCVHQLLKSLFGNNLTSGMNCVNLENRKEQKPHNEDGFYYNLFQRPYTELTNYIDCLNSMDKVECDSDNTVMGYLHRKEIKKPVPKGSDKILANYIRIFEPMVIKSLKQYTISSDVVLQCNVLQLLSQLVQLRVNYCLLDSEQIFIGFVLKQFEFIEEAQIPEPEKLIPKIFKFLVHLSYSKHHSKSIINVPKIIQLCDGLMASGQKPTTYCIPALEPIVEDIFLVRNKSNTADFKELETTREVLLSMLLRLIEYKEVIVLLTLILNDSKYCENSDKWHRWSKQVFDVFLTMLKHNKIRLNDGKTIEAIMKLLLVMNPGVFKNINEILVCLYQKCPLNGDAISKYLGKNVIILLILTHIKEDVLLSKISEASSDFDPSSIFDHIETTPDPLNVINNINYFQRIQPEVAFVKLIFKILQVTSVNCVDEFDEFLVEELFYFMVIVSYLMQSGNYSKISNTAISLINTITSEDKIPIDVINTNFLKIGVLHPTLLFQWCYILTVLNYHNNNFWNVLLNNDLTCKSTSLHQEIIRLGVSITYCEYLTENVHSVEQLKSFLYHNINLIIELCDEIPVHEFIATLHRESNTSLLILKSIEDKSKRNHKPSYLTKILKCLENTNNHQTGYLITLLIKNFLNCRQLALQRSVSILTSRKVEYLLTLTQDEVHNQLSKENLTIIMNDFNDNKFAKRNEGLLSVLNKLATQFYNLPPLELNQRKCVNPDFIRKMEVNKTWYLNEIKNKCRDVMECNQIAELLKILDYNDVIGVMAEKNFNKMILKDVFKKENKKDELDLLKAAVDVLFGELNQFILLSPKNNDDKFSNQDFWNTLQNLIPSVIAYIELDLKIPDSHIKNICIFFVTVLESITYLIRTDKTEVNVHFISKSLECACTVLKNNQLINMLSLQESSMWVSSSTKVIFKLVSFLLLDFEPLPIFTKNNLKPALDDIETSAIANASYQLYVLIGWIESLQVKERRIPLTLFKPIKKIIILLSRLPQVNSYVLTPPSSWKNGWNVELIGPFKNQVPPLPVDYMQQIDVLEEFIYRINLLGWRNRQQFEETWMCLLSVLSSNVEEDCLEDTNRLAHATGLAVSAITSILVLTLYYPNPGNRNTSKIIHVSRDSVIKNNSASIKKLKLIQKDLIDKINSLNIQEEETKIINVFDKQNLEKHHSLYSIGQISIEYLLISSKIVEELDEENPIVQLYHKNQSNLIECGVDLNSCIQFLLDLYSQWLNDQIHSNEQNLAPLRVVNEVIKSVLIISDLFLEKTQFQWMLDSMLNFSKNHASEDEILHQYVIINISKAVAVLNPDMEVYEYIKRLISQGLKSAFLAMRIASLHGLLYLLQGCILSNTVIGGISEELQLFLPLITEYVQCNMNTTNNVLMRSQDHNLLLWAITFYVIEHVKEIHLPIDFVANSVQSAISLLNEQKFTKVFYTAVIKGLERLIITKCLPERLHEQITKLAVDKMKDNNPIYAIPAVQLLISCMYIECEDQLEETEKSNGIVKTTPDNLVKTIEKVSAIFDKIKKGNLFDVEILCAIIPNILNDFFLPSDILTKVVGEFLSPQQNHPKLLSRVVFQVFESGIKQNQLPLLQDWVVFSLSNFAQSFSVGMATWYLTCFFISASTNRWLRSFFPYVQSRIGRYEYEDKKLLCITGSDFYRNLTTDKQRETFIDTFRKIKNQVDMPYNNLLASL